MGGIETLEGDYQGTESLWKAERKGASTLILCQKVWAVLPSPSVTLGNFLLLSVIQSLKFLLSLNHQIFIEHQLI